MNLISVSVVVLITVTAPLSQTLSRDTVSISSLRNATEGMKKITIKLLDSSFLWLNRIEVDTSSGDSYPDKSVAVFFRWKNKPSNCPDGMVIGTKNNMYDSYGCSQKLNLGDSIGLQDFSIDGCFCLVKSSADTIRYGDTANVKMKLYFSKTSEKYGKTVLTFYVKGIYQTTNISGKSKSNSKLPKENIYLINGKLVSRKLDYLKPLNSLRAP